MCEDDIKRGTIKFIDRAKQLISFKGMERRRRITPTDIDGFIDYNGVSFVYIEGKLQGKDLDRGQRMALENVVNSHYNAGNLSMALVFTHNTSADEIIEAKDMPVKEVYFNGQWKCIQGKNVLQMIVRWEKYCESKGLNI